MTEDQEERDRTSKSVWAARVLLGGLAIVVVYPLSWPWVFAALCKLNQLSGGRLVNYSLTETLVSAYAAPLEWLLLALPRVRPLYSAYCEFVVVDLCGVSPFS